MADPHQELFEAVRSVLTSNSTLVAAVPATNIVPGNRALPVEYPSICLVAEGGTDFDFVGSISGQLEIYAYWQAAKPMSNLNDIHTKVRDVLHRQPGAVSNASITVGVMEEIRRHGMIIEDIPEPTYSMMARYQFLANLP